MILTQTVFMHREYMRVFWERAPSAMIQHIDDNMNCEDIALNMIVSELCGCEAALQVAMTSEMYKTSEKGLSNRPGHYAKRYECLNEFAKYYETFPLKKANMTCKY